MNAFKSVDTRVGLLLLLSMLATGCAGGNTMRAADCPVPDLGVDEYLIGTGDTLQINVWRNVELSTTVLVRPDGKVTTPLVEDMPAAGKSTSQLAADIETELAEYLRSPEVSVIVATQGGANQIQVVGEVSRPAPVPYYDGIRVLDVMVAVGGFTDFAAGNRARVVRSIGDRSVECRVRTKDIMSGQLADNIKVYGGDVLVVPETRF